MASISSPQPDFNVLMPKMKNDAVAAEAAGNAKVVDSLIRQVLKLQPSQRVIVYDTNLKEMFKLRHAEESLSLQLVLFAVGEAKNGNIKQAKKDLHQALAYFGELSEQEKLNVGEAIVVAKKIIAQAENRPKIDSLHVVRDLSSNVLAEVQKGHLKGAEAALSKVKNALLLVAFKDRGRALELFKGAEQAVRELQERSIPRVQHTVGAQTSSSLTTPQPAAAAAAVSTPPSQSPSPSPTPSPVMTSPPSSPPPLVASSAASSPQAGAKKLSNKEIQEHIHFWVQEAERAAVEQESPRLAESYFVRAESYKNQLPAALQENAAMHITSAKSRIQSSQRTERGRQEQDLQELEDACFKAMHSGNSEAVREGYQLTAYSYYQKIKLPEFKEKAEQLFQQLIAFRAEENNARVNALIKNAEQAIMNPSPEAAQRLVKNYLGEAVSYKDKLPSPMRDAAALQIERARQRLLQTGSS